MPSVSKKQHNFMAAVANNPKFAKKAGVPRSVGEEFLTADKGKTFKEGGSMKKFPDKNKDGKVTKADVLMAKGVMVKKPVHGAALAYGSFEQVVTPKKPFSAHDVNDVNNLILCTIEDTNWGNDKLAILCAFEFRRN